MSMNYKQSYITWVGVIPKEWEILPTKYVFHNKKNVAGVNEDKYERLALTMKGVLKREKDDNEGLQPESFASYQIVEKNQIIFKLIDLENIKTSRVGLSPYKGLVSPAYIVLGNEKKDNRYYEYYYLTMWFYDVFNYLGNSGVRSSLSATELLNLPIIRPLYGEKKAIADFLDCECEKIHSIIADIESQIELLIKYKESVISEAVTAGVPICESATWKSLRFKYFATISPPISKKGLRSDSEVTFLPMEYIRNGNFTPNISTLENLNSSYNCFENGDILMAKVTPCFENGNIVIAKDLMNDFGYGTSEIFVIRTKENMINRFLFYALQEEKFKKTAVSEMTGTAGLKRVSASFIENYNFKVPQKNQQEAIADYLDAECAKIEDIIKDKQESLEIIKEYKKSLIYEYVTGKKRVKEAK